MGTLRVEFEDYERSVEVDAFGNYTPVEESERMQRQSFEFCAKRCGVWMLNGILKAIESHSSAS